MNPRRALQMAARKRLLERHVAHPQLAGVAGTHVRLVLISAIQLQAVLRGYAGRCAATKRRAERKKQLEAEERKRRKAEKAERDGGLKSRRATIEMKPAAGKAQQPLATSPPKLPVVAPKPKAPLRPSPPRKLSETAAKKVADGLPAQAQACTHRIVPQCRCIRGS